MKQLYRRILIIIHSVILKFMMPGQFILRKLENNLDAQKSIAEGKINDISETTIINSDTTVIGKKPIDTDNGHQVRATKANTAAEKKAKADDLLQPVNQPLNEAKSNNDGTDNKDINNLFHYENDASVESEEATDIEERSGIVLQQLSLSSSGPGIEGDVTVLEQDVDEDTDIENFTPDNNDEPDTASGDYVEAEDFIYKDDNNISDFSNLFGSLVTETATPRSALIASLPLISGQELLEESEYLKSIIRRWQN